MKKLFRYLPFILYTLGFVSFIIPVVYEKLEDGVVSFNMFSLIFGLNGQDLSIGLVLAFIMLFVGIILAISLEWKKSNIMLSIAVIATLASGTLFFFARILSNPSVTGLNINAGLILPGIFIIAGAVILFINNKIIYNKKK
jgi:hypothetical protein